MKVLVHFLRGNTEAILISNTETEQMVVCVSDVPLVLDKKSVNSIKDQIANTSGFINHWSNYSSLLLEMCSWLCSNKTLFAETVDGNCPQAVVCRPCSGIRKACKYRHCMFLRKEQRLFALQQRLLLSCESCQDSWPPEKNSVRGQ